jgi:hypothetical protein
MISARKPNHHLCDWDELLQYFANIRGLGPVKVVAQLTTEM